MLRLCGEVVTEEELLEKTYSTFHSSNVILQQQYRMKGFATYTDLISCLLLAEANNELLMKNSEARPVGTTPLPETNEVENKEPNECNYVRNNKRSHGNDRGGYKGRGRDNYSNSRDNYSTGRKGNHNNRGSSSNYGRGRESLKNENPEAHMVHDSGYDSDIAKNDQMDFETSDCLKD
ncbi:PREDICTED: GATA zinc finger domain-containing protein 14-like [Brassica oleracea var. oleracea]|uniref:GATA zinc finger domain-containing protein 14-like n=1 Tax=Brassica oleracea var. oleracea TaxID=109376 RepID=UPI0006A72669|nr:PREDICTED: GATA zinc finger domain-containing protein 14-like [Brassica oleracea var. oleracea]